MASQYQQGGYGACTIVSLNYLPYARTLCQSFLKHHPEGLFVTLIVDYNSSRVDLSKERFEVVEVEQLGIKEFPSVAFKYTILELNTNVKPTFLRYVFNIYKLSSLIYLDPDIFIYSPLTEAYDLLRNNSIILTPHISKPIKDDCFPTEQDYLSSGIFNLGFIGLSQTAETNTFLDWWEDRCLSLAYHEIRTGLFVDQKWVNLVPCLFDSYIVNKNPGYNVAYWNFHERQISDTKDGWRVNEEYPLVFFHFSGIDPENFATISKFQNRFELKRLEVLRPLFDNYCRRLGENGIKTFKTYKYFYDFYSNGELISPLARRLYAEVFYPFDKSNPFDADNRFYAWVRKNHLHNYHKQNKYISERTFKKDDTLVVLFNRMLKVLIFAFGVNRYISLMKYFSYIGILRNQREVFKL
jgi:hypothetical protein